MEDVKRGYSVDGDSVEPNVPERYHTEIQKYLWESIPIVLKIMSCRTILTIYQLLSQ